MLDDGLIRLLEAYKFRKITERLCNCKMHFTQLEELPEYVIDELVRKYTEGSNGQNQNKT